MLGLKTVMPYDELIELVNKMFPGQLDDSEESRETEEKAEQLIEMKKMFERLKNWSKSE